MRVAHSQFRDAAVVDGVRKAKTFFFEGRDAKTYDVLVNTWSLISFLRCRDGPSNGCSLADLQWQQREREPLGDHLVAAARRHRLMSPSPMGTQLTSCRLSAFNVVDDARHHYLINASSIDELHYHHGVNPEDSPTPNQEWRLLPVSSVCSPRRRRRMTTCSSWTKCSLINNDPDTPSSTRQQQAPLPSSTTTNSALCPAPGCPTYLHLNVKCVVYTRSVQQIRDTI